MSTLGNLARYESPHSGLAFRKSIYAPDEHASVIIDCLALANAELKGRRFLFLGIDDDGNGDRRIIGVDKAELKRFKGRFKQLVSEHVEPELDATVRAVEVDDLLVGYIRIKDCNAPPYLAKQSIGDALMAGTGFIRRGARNMPLQRSDMQRMFKRNQEPVVESPSIRIGFPGKEPMEHMSLPVLALNKLPSELAEYRLKSLLAAKDQARDLFGRTETQFSRLMHAKLYGMDVPFAKRSDDSLLDSLQNVEDDYGAADEHYMYEVRAHQLNLLVVNTGEANLHNAHLSVTLPRADGIGVAERVYTEDLSELQPDGYPSVELSSRTISIDAELGTLYAGRSTRAFREPARFWAREQAAGQAVAVDYELTADELEQALQGSLVIYIDKASLKSV